MTSNSVSDTSSLRLIPTPQNAQFVDGNHKTYSRDKVYTISVMEQETAKLRFAARYLKEQLEEQFGLHFNVQWRQLPNQEEDIVVYSNPTLQDTHLPLDLGVFDQENAAEQGYVVRSEPGQPVCVCAQSDQGSQYGIATLTQLLSATGGHAVLPNVLIEDFPQYRYRGNRWLIKVEQTNWAYDWGDGGGAFRERVREKLDLALLCKVNVIIFDGWGWGLDTFPELAGWMREFNREARLRGIHLMHSGFGSGIAGGFRDRPRLYRGQVLENRREYPDGEIYHCIAGERYCATCLSNESLMQLRLDDIRTFVQEVEPGALYIHQQDEGLTPETWLKRCPDCRKKWPNDEIAAADGMAGAYAYLYDRMTETVQSVQNDGYSGAKDCLIMPISPGYLSYGLDDQEWNIGLRYWSTLSGLLKRRENVFPGFREIFINQTDDRRRARQLKEAFNTNGEGQTYGILFFYGADSHHNDKLFLPVPALNYIFEGTDMLLSPCGHSYSEPLQLLNAEYMWNPHSSGFFTFEEKPEDFASIKKLYFECQYNEFQPEALFHDFLGTACAKLYGKEAGAVMHEMFRIEGKNHEPPIPYLDNSGLIRGEMRGSEAEGGGREGSVFQYYSWPSEAPEEKRALIRERIRESLAATVKASEVLERGLQKENLEEKGRDYIRWYASSLEEGVRYVGYLDSYVSLVDEVDSGQSPSIASDTNLLLGELAERREHNRRSRLQPVDYAGGTLSGREEIIDFVEANLKKLLEQVEDK